MKVLPLPKGMEICLILEKPKHAVNCLVAFLGPHKKCGVTLGLSYGPPTWWRWRLSNKRRRQGSLLIHDLDVGWLQLNLGFALAHKAVAA